MTEDITIVEGLCIGVFFPELVHLRLAHHLRDKGVIHLSCDCLPPTYMYCTAQNLAGSARYCRIY